MKSKKQQFADAIIKACADFDGEIYCEDGSNITLIVFDNTKETNTAWIECEAVDGERCKNII